VAQAQIGRAVLQQGVAGGRPFGRWRRHESPARYCSGEWSILPSVVWTEGWGTSVRFSALSPSVLRVNPQVPLTVERLQILGHRKTTKRPTLPAPRSRGRREGLGTPCYNCAMNYCGGIISRCAEVSRESAGTARATRPMISLIPCMVISAHTIIALQATQGQARTPGT